MTFRRLATTWIATLAGCSAIAQVPEGSTSAQPLGTPPHIELYNNDVTFNQKYFRLGLRNWNASCGYSILGNHLSREVPRSEWAVSVDEVMDGDTPVVRVRAAAFQVVSKGRDGIVKTRPPIAMLTFSVKGEGEPLTARITGRTSGVNSITATLETAPAQRLLEALHNEQPIEISLTYQDDTTEVLEVRNWWDSEPNYLHQCLEHLRPAPAGVHFFTYTLDSVSGPGRGLAPPPDGK